MTKRLTFACGCERDGCASSMQVDRLSDGYVRVSLVEHCNPRRVPLSTMLTIAPDSAAALAAFLQGGEA